MPEVQARPGLTTEAELEALPLLAVIMDDRAEPYAWQKRMVTVGGLRLARWFCTAGTDWPESSERILRGGRTFITLWLPEGAV